MMRSSSFGVVLCIMLMPFLSPFSHAFDKACFDDCIDNSLCEGPRISQCIAHCRAICGGAEKLALGAPLSCKLGCSFSLCSKFVSDAKGHQTCLETCSKNYCKF